LVEDRHHHLFEAIDSGQSKLPVAAAPTSTRSGRSATAAAMASWPGFGAAFTVDLAAKKVSRVAVGGEVDPLPLRKPLGHRRNAEQAAGRSEGVGQ
jgi:hypothetical protein